MDYKNLERLYPVKIPVYAYADYYIQNLAKSKEYEKITEWISLCEDFERIPNFLNLKLNTIDSTIEYFKSIGIYDQLNAIQVPQYKLTKLDLTPEENKFYVSYDVRQANWSIVRYFLHLDLPDWEIYSDKVLNYHPALSNSKSYRQLIFGNWNAKKIKSLQEYITSKHIDILNQYEYNIVGINAEELILEISKPEDILKLSNISWILPVKAKIFKTRYVNNFDEYIRIDSILDESFKEKYKKLVKVNGNRFFIHFKTLILKEQLEDIDLLFCDGKYLAKWVI